MRDGGQVQRADKACRQKCELTIAVWRKACTHIQSLVLQRQGSQGTETQPTAKTRFAKESEVAGSWVGWGKAG